MIKYADVNASALHFLPFSPRIMTVHIDTTGHGPPLVLLHGWAMHSGVFSALAERLREAHTLYLVDLPGHGHSRGSTLPLALEPVTQTLLNTLPPAIWLGWSLGGLFALHAAAQTNVLAATPASYPPLPLGEGTALASHRRALAPNARRASPGRNAGRGEGNQRSEISALIMLASTPRFVHADDWPHGMPAATFAQFAASLDTDHHATLERFIALETFGSEHARDELRTLRQLLFSRGEPTRQALTDGLALLQHTDLRPHVQNLSIPCLWLSGRRDRLVHPHAIEAAAALTPNACTAILPRAGHAPMLTHADALAAEILRFTSA